MDGLEPIISQLSTYPTPNSDFIDDYVAMAPFNGEAFIIDLSEVLTLIVKFIAGNETAEAKIFPFVVSTNGKGTFKALIEHYEGVGLNSVDNFKGDEDIDSLFYAGEKRSPHVVRGFRETTHVSIYCVREERE